MPSEAVTKIKLKHMYRTAKLYIQQKKLDKEYIRFDVIEVYFNGKNYKINHLMQVI